MNRFGWLMLLLFVVAGGFFALVVKTGGGAMFTAPPPVTSIAPAAQPRANLAPSGLAVPVSGVMPSQLADTYEDDRGGGTRVHHAIDIAAPRGTPVLATAAGTVEKLFESKDGGHTVYVRTPDGVWVHYYAHLDTYADGLAAGDVVAKGQQIGTVGSSGNANPAGPHLHFEIKRMAAGEKWWQGTAINPYPVLSGR